MSDRAVEHVCIRAIPLHGCYESVFRFCNLTGEGAAPQTPRISCGGRAAALPQNPHPRIMRGCAPQTPPRKSEELSERACIRDYPELFRQFRDCSEVFRYYSNKFVTIQHYSRLFAGCPVILRLHNHVSNRLVPKAGCWEIGFRHISLEKSFTP